MNRFEKAVYDCMLPTARLLEETKKPLHRAILLNFWRHVHLEGSGQYDKIIASDMMVDRPVYRVTWGANPAVLEGKDLLTMSTTEGANELLVGAIVSFVVGVVSLKLLLKMLNRGKLHWFACWTIPVGLATIAWQLTR